MMEGYIFLHRRIADNPTLIGDNDRFKVFLQLLIRATHKTIRYEFNGEDIILTPGQAVIRLRGFAEECNVSKTKLIRILDVFKKRTMIGTQTGPHGTLVTVCNWSQYQMSPQKSGPPNIEKADQDRTTKQEGKNLNKKESTDSESLQLACPASPDRFADWWAHWRLKGAKRGDKQRAKRLYDAAIKSGIKDHEQLCHDVDRLQAFYEQSGTPTSKQLHPATWLYQKRWADELVLDQPERKTTYGPSSPEDLAARFVRNHGFGDPDDPPPQAPKLGQGNGEHPNGQERPGSGDRDDGENLPELPPGFDQEGD